VEQMPGAALMSKIAEFVTNSSVFALFIDSICLKRYNINKKSSTIISSAARI
jgi:hypothetical protein